MFDSSSTHWALEQSGVWAHSWGLGLGGLVVCVTVSFTCCMNFASIYESVTNCEVIHHLLSHSFKTVTALDVLYNLLSPSYHAGCTLSHTHQCHHCLQRPCPLFVWWNSLLSEPASRTSSWDSSWLCRT